MSFLHPEFFAIFALLMIVVLKGRASKKRLSLELFWIYATIIFITLALTRPVLTQEAIEIDETGSDVILGVDLSYSMMADDIKPNRLERAKELLKELVEMDSKDRFAIMGFTTNAIVLSPLTKDVELLLHLFDRLDESLIMTKGSSIMPSLELARKMSKSSTPIVLLLTDGADEEDYSSEAHFAHENSMIVNIAMLATSVGSSITDFKGKKLQDKSGNIVISAKNRAIESISSQSSGTMLDNPSASELLSLIKSQRNNEQTSKSEIIQYQELFYYCIFLAIVTFMLAFTILKNLLFKRFMGLFLLIGISADASLIESYYLKSATALYAEEKYIEAAAEFTQVDSTKARYNAAISLYKAGKYNQSIELFESLRSADSVFKSDIYYNMASCYIRLQEFKKAEDALQKSLTLHFSQEAVENLVAISGAIEQDFMVSGRQEGKKRANESEAKNSSKNKQKEGGGSNMKTSAEGKKGAGDGGKKVESEAMFSLNQAKAKLSSKQYELINERGVNESKPW